MSTSLPGYHPALLSLPSALIAYRRLIGWTAFLCFSLIMIGAWVRLTDAGLGCPDWPGCYGKFTPVQAKAQIEQAIAEQGGEHGPVSMGKAWREMVHRYIATGLGLLIIGIVAFAWRLRHLLGQSPWLATLTLGVVILQGLFGKWTVTLLLKPAIVTGHLIGGLLTFSLLFWLWLRTKTAIETLGTGLHAGSRLDRAVEARFEPQDGRCHCPDREQHHLAAQVVAHLDLFLVVVGSLIDMVVALWFEEEMACLTRRHCDQPRDHGGDHRIDEQISISDQKAAGADQMQRLVDQAMVVVAVVIPALFAQHFSKTLTRHRESS